MGSERPPPSLLETLQAFFDREGWNMRPSAEGPFLTTEVDGDSGSWSAAAWVPEERGPVVFYSHLPYEVPPERRGDVAAFVARANFGLLVGNFEMDPDDGSVRYKTSVGVLDVEVSDQLLRELVYLNVATTDRYLSALGSVVSGEATADQALKAGEER